MPLLVMLILWWITAHLPLSSTTSQQTADIISLSSLFAPLYRNVTGGQAWTLPSSDLILGTRDTTCECFDPEQQCCTSPSPSSSLFCVPQDATCCGLTFCLPGESCCGSFCCSSGTTCNIHILSNSGCCPLGSFCDSTASPICHDHTSPTCSGPDSHNPFLLPPPLSGSDTADGSTGKKGNDGRNNNKKRDTSTKGGLGCCPSTLPYCRSLPPGGWGCYASQSVSPSSTTVPSISSISPLPPRVVFPLSAGGSGSATTETTTETYTISAVAVHGPSDKNDDDDDDDDDDDNNNKKKKGEGWSFIFPSISPPPPQPPSSALQGPEVETVLETKTIYIVAWPPTTTSSHSSSTSITSTIPSPLTTSPSPSTTEASERPTSTTTKAHISHLCFNPILQSPDICPSSSTSTSTSTTEKETGPLNPEIFSPSGARIVLPASSSTSGASSGIRGLGEKWGIGLSYFLMMFLSSLEMAVWY